MDKDNEGSDENVDENYDEIDNVEEPTAKDVDSKEEENEDDLLEYMSDDGGKDEELEEFEQKLKALETALSNSKSVVNAYAKRVIVVQNLPIVTPEKLEKLYQKIEEIFSQIGKLQPNSEGKAIYIPMNASKNESLGFAFVSFAEEESASAAIEKINGFAFGKQLLQVLMYSDLDKYAKWSDKFVAPIIKEYQQDKNLDDWLLDPLGRDQFVLRYGKNTEIYWYEGSAMEGDTTLVYGGERETKENKIWCEMQVAWSPKGKYLATFHLQGIALWAGDTFEKIGRFPHHGVRHIEFSPCERYIMTWDGKDNTEDLKSLLAWNIKTGENLRGFKVAEGSKWPIMKWSYDGEYFARVTENGISIFETKEKRLFGGKPVVARAIVDFAWSPSENILAYWSNTEGNLPPRITIMDPFKGGKEIKTKPLVNIDSIDIIWQANGDFLCAHVHKLSKSKRSTTTTLEIFRLRQPGIPNESEVFTENINHFSFEPHGSRFGVITGTEARANITFYDLGSAKTGKDIKKIIAISNKPVNNLYWSPVGRNVILANLNNNSGELEFWDLDEKRCINTETHFMCNTIQWDPSGRIVATCVIQPMFGAVSMRHTMENGYKLWTMHGEKLCDSPKKDFYQFLWRPRPINIVSLKDKTAIESNIKKYIEKYDKEDEDKIKKKVAAKNTVKVQQLQQFRHIMSELQKDFVKAEERRKALGLPLLGEKKREDDYDEVEIVTEKVVSEKIEFF